MNSDGLSSLKNTNSNESWKNGKQKITALKDTIQNSITNNTNPKGYATFSYVPLVGPLISFYFKKTHKIIKLHTENALYLQISFLFIWLCVWLAENIPIISSFLKIFQFVPFVTNALMYLNITIFILTSTFGAWNAYKEKQWVVPYLYKFVHQTILKGSAHSKSNKNINNTI